MSSLVCPRPSRACRRPSSKTRPFYMRDRQVRLPLHPLRLDPRRCFVSSPWTRSNTCKPKCVSVNWKTSSGWVKPSNASPITSLNAHRLSLEWKPSRSRCYRRWSTTCARSWMKLRSIKRACWRIEVREKWTHPMLRRSNTLRVHSQRLTCHRSLKRCKVVEKGLPQISSTLHNQLLKKMLRVTLWVTALI